MIPVRLSTSVQNSHCSADIITPHDVKVKPKIKFMLLYFSSLNYIILVKILGLYGNIRYLPLGISFILLPALMVVGGRDLGACGTNNEAMDVFVQIMWFLIPSGWVVSFLCTPFLFIFRKTRKASFLLLLCFLIFPIYFLLCSMLTKYS